MTNQFKRSFALFSLLLLAVLASKSVLQPAVATEAMSQSFVSGTTVWTESGPRAIETLTTGDLVWVEDEAHGQVELKAVTETDEQQVSTTLLVTFTSGEQIEATAQHPIYVEGSGFTSANQLVVGDSIVTRVGPSQTVAAIAPQTQSRTAYSFTVADCNTYFVGQSGFWVSH